MPCLTCDMRHMRHTICRSCRYAGSPRLPPPVIVVRASALQSAHDENTAPMSVASGAVETGVSSSTLPAACPCWTSGLDLRDHAPRSGRVGWVRQGRVGGGCGGWVGSGPLVLQQVGFGGWRGVTPSFALQQASKPHGRLLNFLRGAPPPPSVCVPVLFRRAGGSGWGPPRFSGRVRCSGVASAAL